MLRCLLIALLAFLSPGHPALWAQVIPTPEEVTETKMEAATPALQSKYLRDKLSRYTGLRGGLYSLETPLGAFDRDRFDIPYGMEQEHLFQVHIEREDAPNDEEWMVFNVATDLETGGQPVRVVGLGMYDLEVEALNDTTLAVAILSGGGRMELPLQQLYDETGELFFGFEAPEGQSIEKVMLPEALGERVRELGFTTIPTSNSLYNTLGFLGAVIALYIIMRVGRR